MANVKLIKNKTAHGIPIEVTIQDIEWKAEANLDHFLDFVLDKVGNPAALLTKASLKARIHAAKDEFLAHMRAEIVKKV